MAGLFSRPYELPHGKGPLNARPYFGWAACCAPFAGALAGLVPSPRPDLMALVIGSAVASAVGMICVAVAIKRRERPWWPWVIGLLLNAYPFLWLLIGLSLGLGIMHFHL